MYYLFGAGSNCYSVIGFIGKERIKGIVDNDISKIGKQYCDCPIISFDQFLKQYQGELVIISTFALAVLPSNIIANSSKVGRFFHEPTRPQVMQIANRFSSKVCSR